MKKLLLFLILPFFALAQFDVCDHTFVMNDSYGDGWNGALVNIIVNGEAVVTGVTPAAGAGGGNATTENFTFAAADGATIQLTWTATGTWASEISWSVLNGYDGAVINSGSTPSVGTETVGSALCFPPACPDPAITGWTMGNYDVFIEGTNDDSIVGYQLEYSTSSFTPGDGTATVVTFESFPYTLTGLDASTTYYFAMRSDCGDGVFGNYIGPNSYSTGFVLGCGESFGIPYGSNPTVSTGATYPGQWDSSQVTDFFLKATTNPGTGVSNTITITGQTELNYDYVYIVEMTTGEVLLTPTSGVFDGLEVTGVGELGIYIVADGSVDSTSNPEYTPVFTVSCSTAGLDDLSSNLFTYFPNPVNDQLTIRAQKNVDEITVYNMIGQVVLRQMPNSLETMVDMAEIQTGAYFVQVSIDNSIETVRILKN